MLKSVGRVIAYIIFAAGVLSAFAYWGFEHQDIQHGTKAAIPAFLSGCGALMISLFGRDFAWKNGKQAPRWAGRACFAGVGLGFLFVGWGIMHQ